MYQYLFNKMFYKKKIILFYSNTKLLFFTMSVPLIKHFIFLLCTLNCEQHYFIIHGMEDTQKKTWYRTRNIFLKKYLSLDLSLHDKSQ